MGPRARQRAGRSRGSGPLSACAPSLRHVPELRLLRRRDRVRGRSALPDRVRARPVAAAAVAASFRLLRAVVGHGRVRLPRRHRARWPGRQRRRGAGVHLLDAPAGAAGCPWAVPDVPDGAGAARGRGCRRRARRHDRPGGRAEHGRACARDHAWTAAADRARVRRAACRREPSGRRRAEVRRLRRAAVRRHRGHDHRGRGAAVSALRRGAGGRAGGADRRACQRLGGAAGRGAPEARAVGRAAGRDRPPAGARTRGPDPHVAQSRRRRAAAQGRRAGRAGPAGGGAVAPRRSVRAVARRAGVRVAAGIARGRPAGHGDLRRTARPCRRRRRGVRGADAGAGVAHGRRAGRDRQPRRPPAAGHVRAPAVPPHARGGRRAGAGRGGTRHRYSPHRLGSGRQGAVRAPGGGAGSPG